MRWELEVEEREGARRPVRPREPNPIGVFAERGQVVEPDLDPRHRSGGEVEGGTSPAPTPPAAPTGSAGLSPAGWRSGERTAATGPGATQGIPTSRIAEEVHLSEGTVRNYLSEAIGKLGAANRIEAARIARDKGWL